MARPPALPGPLARHRLAALPLAVLLAAGAALVPPAAAPALPLLAAFDAPVARAADGLAIGTEARYVVEPDDAVIRVTVNVSVRNDKPNRVSGGAITRYYYDAVNIGVQSEARRIRATQGGTALPVDVARREGYRLVTIGLRASLFYGQSATVRLTFDLPSGEPRSASDVRVGKAFVTFLAWAFGDSGTVRVEIPEPFEVSASGEEMDTSSVDGGTVLTATARDALSWYAWVNARNDLDLSRELLDIEGGERIVVRGWPEDRRWREHVGRVLARGVPQLIDQIGLPWPVDGPLTVIEVHTPLLEGYAGLYDTATDEITASEELDDLTIVHEVSHAWFNSRLFAERWVSEGLADEYATRVLVALGEQGSGPGKVSRTADVAFPLNDWPPPSAIRDEDAGRRERYGYDASWRVIRSILELIGEDGMRAVFAAADAGTTAYVGADPTERTALPNDWRRLLDLVEELGGTEGADDLLATWALTGAQAASLPQRDEARAAYHDLLAAADGWVAPAAVRQPLDRWAFAEAEAAIAAASGVLERRDELAAAAAEAGLAPPDDLEAAYEGAADAVALAEAAGLADESASALDAISAAGDAADSPRDWLAGLGLAGEDPDADVVAARDAWERGDLATSTARAAEASSVLAAAPELGRQRATVIGAAAGTVVLLLVVVVIVGRRRRHASATLPASAASDTETGTPPNDEQGAEPS